jgi:hypothetical protein
MEKNDVDMVEISEIDESFDHEISVIATIDICSTGKSNAKIDGKPIFKFKDTIEYNYKHQKLVKRYYHVDNLNDKYDEVIKIKGTDEIIHECHEKVSEHVGHGSAKKK